MSSLGFIVPLAGGDPIPLTKDAVTIGRRPECDIRLEAVNISGKHAEMRFYKGQWVIIDLGSTNGTKVNGTKVKKKKLSPGDEIAIARKHRFRFEFDAAEAVNKRPSEAPPEPAAKPPAEPRTPPKKRPTAPNEFNLDLDEDEEEVHDFKKPLMERARLVHGSKVEDDEIEEDDLKDLEDLDSLFADEPTAKPKLDFK
jgi:hypothetical protein